jgi:hypothetical protein
MPRRHLNDVVVLVALTRRVTTCATAGRGLPAKEQAGVAPVTSPYYLGSFFSGQVLDHYLVKH